MAFSNSTLSILVLVALAVAVLTLLLSLPWSMRDRPGRVRHEIPLDKRLELTADQHDKQIARLEGAVRQLALGERRLGELAEEAVRHVAIVRFDAFEDMGGRLSFSAALLDGHGDGLVITSINGRQDTRVYAKQIEGGTSINNLSDEERQAIREALGGGSEGTRRIAEAR
jgi:hypothetical protein